MATRRPRGSSDADATRERILAAAEACFVEEGYAAGTRRIAERAGVTQPLLLHHFGSKDGLFDATIERALGRLVARQSVALVDEPDHLAFVLTGLRSLIHATIDDPALLRLVTWARLANRSPFTRGAAEFWHRLLARFEAAQRAGIVRDDLDATALVVVIDAAVKGLGERLPIYSAAERQLKASNAPSPRIPDALYAVLLHGILTPAALQTARTHLAGTALTERTDVR